MGTGNICNSHTQLFFTLLFCGLVYKISLYIDWNESNRPICSVGKKIIIMNGRKTKLFIMHKPYMHEIGMTQTADT